MDLRARTLEMFGVATDDASLIEPGLWLANVCGSVNADFLALHNVTRIVNMAAEWCALRSTSRVLRQCLVLDDSLGLDPAATARLLAHGAELVAEGRARNETVMVHCNMGVSRSAAVVVRYLLNRDPRLSYDEALAQVRAARPIARPNALFESLLNTVDERKRRWKAKWDL